MKVSRQGVFLKLSHGRAQLLSWKMLLPFLFAFVVLAVFMLPALRDGAPAVPVALVASAAILFAVI